MMLEVCCSLVLVLAAEGDGKPPPSLVLGQKQKVAFLGDGVTQDAFRTGGYIWWMQSALRLAYPDLTLTFLDASRRGDHVTDMARRFEKTVLAEKPNWIVIFTGLNDVWDGFDAGSPEGNGKNGTPLSEFKAKLNEIVSAGMKAGAQVVLCTTTVLTEQLDGAENELLEKYNDVLAKSAAEHKCMLLDFNKAFHDILSQPGMRFEKTGGKYLTRDGMRPNARGSQLLAEVALRAFGMPQADFDRVCGEVKKQAGG
jgi:lysophospholipase L1-like esterase